MQTINVHFEVSLQYMLRWYKALFKNLRKIEQIFPSSVFEFLAVFIWLHIRLNTKSHFLKKDPIDHISDLSLFMILSVDRPIHRIVDKIKCVFVMKLLKLRV